ncbi:UTP--glucose-1-phosphate uridylyltransferase family [Hyaloraphidium curvatum]|nr:UTP--glucose-1-phosphate uridylyltransferase family [Hyaloraphidium curvatum]
MAEGFSSEGPAHALRRELDKLISTAPERDRSWFAPEMDAFYDLFVRWQRTRSTKLNWDRVVGQRMDEMVKLEELPEVAEARIPQLLSKLAIVKLNGGLGTSMGLQGPKSAIEVRDGSSFLDLAVTQVRYLSRKYGVKVPLVLMNSFNTAETTSKLIGKFEGDEGVDIRTFDQAIAPRISRESLLPVPATAEITAGTKQHWYPPGHGDIWASMVRSGILDSLLDEGKEWVFVSNIDNLGATVDLRILQHLCESRSADFLLEMTPKTRSDIKGGTLIEYEGQTRLLEVAQVALVHRNDFYSVKKFSTFNTNNLWVNLKALKDLFDRHPHGPELDIIENPKTTDSGEAVIQLETAMASAIRAFEKSGGILVPRSRFVPVKNTADLLLAQSEGLYSLRHGQLVINPTRPFSSTPVIKLGNEFSKIADYDRRFESPPNILDLDHLTVSGDVWFHGQVVLAGTVIIVATHGQRIDIPAGSILENKIVTGNLRILDH